MTAVKRIGPPGGGAGMEEAAPGPSGGGCGTSGGTRRLAWLMLASFAAILIVVTIGEAESMLSDFAAARVAVAPAHVWIWQVTSVAAWASVMPALWWAVARIRPPRFGWRGMVAALVIGTPLASAWHVGLMILLRTGIYAARGETYRFAGWIAHPYLYEFRKDVATYLQFVAFAALCRWLLRRAAEPSAPAASASAGPRFLDVGEGARTHRVPVDEIDAVTAAGNYVELAWAGRTLLHRATLAATEAALGPAFARIHRSRLVRRDAIRAIETNQAGDFEVALADGTRLKGSRRYRVAVEEPAF